VAWLESIESGQRLDVIWPAGFGARFDPELSVVDGEGNVVMSEGDVVEGGCVFDEGVVLLGWWP
jgi:hypothetical protein